MTSALLDLCKRPTTSSKVQKIFVVTRKYFHAFYSYKLREIMFGYPRTYRFRPYLLHIHFFLFVDDCFHLK